MTNVYALYRIGSLMGHGPVICLLAAMDFPTAVIDPQNETSVGVLSEVIAYYMTNTMFNIYLIQGAAEKVIPCRILQIFKQLFRIFG